jgi:hypothetical protein
VSNARRAARALIRAINDRPMDLVEWRGRYGSMTRHVERVRSLWQHWQGGRANLVAMPVGRQPGGGMSTIRSAIPL